jgi:hypothetical protein
LRQLTIAKAGRYKFLVRDLVSRHRKARFLKVVLNYD